MMMVMILRLMSERVIKFKNRHCNRNCTNWKHNPLLKISISLEKHCYYETFVVLISSMNAYKDLFIVNVVILLIDGVVAYQLKKSHS